MRVVGLARPLELRHVAAVELEVLGGGERRADVAREADRHERGPCGPTRTAPRRRARAGGVQKPFAVRLLQVDVARRGVERGAAARRQVGAQELVDAGGRPAVLRARDDAADDRLDDRRGAGWMSPSCGRDQRSSGAHGRSRSQASEGASRTRRADALGVAQPDLERDPAAHAVADQVRRARARARRAAPTTAPGEERRVVGARASGLAESPKPGRSTRSTRWCGASARRSAGTTPSSRRGRGAAAPARPRPASDARSSPVAVSHLRKRRRAVAVAPAVAARKPTPRCRSSRTCSRPAETRPCRRAGRRRSAPRCRDRRTTLRLGAAPRTLEAGFAPLDHHVVGGDVVGGGVADVDPQSHERPSHVEHGRVVAGDQALECASLVVDRLFGCLDGAHFLPLSVRGSPNQRPTCSPVCE